MLFLQPPATYGDVAACFAAVKNKSDEIEEWARAPVPMTLADWEALYTPCTAPSDIADSSRSTISVSESLTSLNSSITSPTPGNENL